MIFKKSCKSKYPPKQKSQTNPYDHSQDNGISSFTQIDFLHKIVDHWKPIRDIIQFSLNSFKSLPLVGQCLSGLDSNADLIINQPFRMPDMFTFP